MARITYSILLCEVIDNKRLIERHERHYEN